jgi:hypothetical protein
MVKRFVNSFEVVEISEEDGEHWVTLRGLRGERFHLRVPDYTANELHVGGVVGIYIEI